MRGTIPSKARVPRPPRLRAVSLWHASLCPPSGTSDRVQSGKFRCAGGQRGPQSHDEETNTWGRFGRLRAVNWPRASTAALCKVRGSSKHGTIFQQSSRSKPQTQRCRNSRSDRCSGASQCLRCLPNTGDLPCSVGRAPRGRVPRHFCSSQPPAIFGYRGLLLLPRPGAANDASCPKQKTGCPPANAAKWL